MSERVHVSYNATDNVAEYILAQMDDFYSSHPDAEDSFLLFFKQIMRRVLKGWKKRMMNRHPNHFNDEMSKCTDVSKRQIERISLKD